MPNGTIGYWRDVAQTIPPLHAGTITAATQSLVFTSLLGPVKPNFPEARTWRRKKVSSVAAVSLKS